VPGEAGTGFYGVAGVLEGSPVVGAAPRAEWGWRDVLSLGAAFFSATRQAEADGAVR
jgi:hypothetical protein